MLVAADSHAGLELPVVDAERAGCAAVCFDVPNNPTFIAAGGPPGSTQVPIYYDNNHNGVFDAGIDVPFDNRFVTGGKYIQLFDIHQRRQEHAEPAVPRRRPEREHRRSTSLTCIDAGQHAAFVGHRDQSELEAQRPVVVPVGFLVPHVQEQFHGRHRRLAARGAAAAPSAGPQVSGRRSCGSARTTARSISRSALFYLDQKTEEDARVDLPYVGFDFIHGPDLVPATNKAIYGNAAIHLTQKLDLSVGARYSKDEKSYTFHRPQPGRHAAPALHDGSGSGRRETRRTAA